jgi:protease-4
MKKLIVRILATIGGAVVLMVLVGVIVSWVTIEQVPQKIILEIDFQRGLAEYVPDGSFTRVFQESPHSVRDLVEALARAAGDKRVAAVIARVGPSGMGLAQIQEIRDAMHAFRATGKPAVAYAETFGEGGPGNGSYYLATAFDEIYVQPSGDIGLTGLMFESPFVQGTLEKLGIVPRLDHRKEYKNAMNIFTERQYTAPHREAVQQVMESQFGQMIQGIAATRKLGVEQVRALVDRGPFLGAQALEEKLIDGLAYRDEVYAKIQEKVGQDAERLSWSEYLSRAGRPYTTGETIALIYGVGAVHRGKSGGDSPFGDTSMGSDTVASAFRAAVKDKSVKAILFRIDSPGGSYVASDTIWRETVRAKQAGKPVIVSMGNVAGSGGYFVAMDANKIVAQPGTITGSIGVVFGKMLTTGLTDKLGLSWDEVHTSENAAIWSTNHDFTPAQWTQLQQWLDRVYDDFTSKAAQGRNLPKEKILEVAKGRIWTGDDAKNLGLVDELGGFPVALRLAKEAAGIPADAEIQLRLFPPRRLFLQEMVERLLGEEEEESMEEVPVELTHSLKMIRSLARLAEDLGLGPERGVLSMPHVPLAQ